MAQTTAPAPAAIRQRRVCVRGREALTTRELGTAIGSWTGVLTTGGSGTAATGCGALLRRGLGTAIGSWRGASTAGGSVGAGTGHGGLGEIWGGPASIGAGSGEGVSRG